MVAQIDIRPSPIAGKWYPADANKLARQVDGYINAAQVAPFEDDIVAIIVPHAGHIYSGPVAGYAFAALRGLEPALVCVVSPMHYNYPQALITTAHQAYATPLGQVMVDREAQEKLNEQLKQKLGYGLAFIKNDPEHSLEIELPFLQRVFPTGFQLLPVMVRDQSPQVTLALGEALAVTIMGTNAVLVASTDLSHFYTQAVAEKLDAVMLAQMEAFDPEGVLKTEQEGRGFACGHGAVAAVLQAAKSLGADQVKILHYATSGDVSGDYEQVVGYGAAAVIRKRAG
jgi:hypothetical protein